MPARDRYHNQVKTALQRDGWTITHDPLKLKWGAKDMYVDLFEEPIGQLLLADRQIQLIVFDPVTEAIRLWTPETPSAQ